MKRLLILVIALIQVVLNLNAQSAKSDSLFALGIDLYNAGKYKEAIPLFQDCIRLDSILSPYNKRREYSRMWLASCYAQQGDSAKAMTISEFYKKPVDRRLTVKSDSLANLGELFYKKAKYEDEFKMALDYFRQTLEVERNVLGEQHPWYINSIIQYTNKLSDLFIDYGDNALGAEAHQLISRIPDNENPLYSKVLSFVSLYNYKKGDYSESIQFGTKAVQRMEMDPIIDYSLYTGILNNIVFCNIEKRNFENALSYGTKLLKTLEKTPEKRNPLFVVKAYNNVARTYLEMSNYDEAIQLGDTALDLYDKSPQKDNKLYATLLTLLAECNQKKGNYVKARDFCAEALQFKELNGKNNASYVAGLNVLASIYVELRDFDKALSLSNEALHILEESPYIDKSLFITVYNNILVSNYEKGHYTEALKISTEAQQLLERIPKRMFIQYAPTIINITQYIFASGNIEEAISLGTEILDILEESPNIDRYSYMRALSLNANIYRTKGNYHKAILLGDKALQISKAYLGEKHPNYAFSLLEMAYLYSFIGNIPSIEKNVEASYDIYTHFIHNTLIDLTEYERSLFWGLYQNLFHVWAHNFSCYFPTAILLENGYNASLLYKNLLLSLTRSLSEIIQDSGDKEALALYEELKNNRKILQMLYEKPISERHFNTDSLENIANQQERKLIKKSKTYGDYVKNLDIQWDDVQRALGTNDVAIEFVSFPLNADSTMYIAYVLQKDMKHPELVPLFEENQLKSIMNAYGQNVYKAYEQKKVSELVWQPLSKYLNGKTNIYFAPDGELYNIGIENMPHWYEDCLMSDKWNIYRLSSTRELTIVKKKKKYRKAALYGGITYDTDIDLLKNDSIRFPNIGSLETILFGEREPLYANELPETKIEVEEVNKLLIQNKRKTTLKTDTLATEGDFKYLSGKKNNLLHIATHGYYLPEEEAKGRNHTDFTKMISMTPQYVEDNALNRSALLFAGVNNLLRGDSLPKNVNDGFLTAREISQIDLRGLELAVLSACETGKGDITAEGVFGLQRGFKKAGAKSILMSLWEVDDKATQLLMVQFYKNLLLGKSKYESLKDSQKYLRDEHEEKVDEDVETERNLSRFPKGRAEDNVEKVTVRKKIYKDPYYWAAFVLLDGID